MTESENIINQDMFFTSACFSITEDTLGNRFLSRIRLDYPTGSIYVGLDDSSISCETVTLTGPIRGFHVSKNPGNILAGIYIVYEDLAPCHIFIDA